MNKRTNASDAPFHSDLLKSNQHGFWRVLHGVLPSMAIALLAGCTSMPAGSSGALASLHLFDATNAPRFALYVSCSGQVAAEADLCWVPFKYFAEWAGERHVLQKQLAMFDANAGMPAAARNASDSGLDYRIVVSFMPIALPSYPSEVGMSGYIAPKAGYKAEVFVYSIVSGKLVAKTTFYRKSDAKFKGDSVPFVKDGVRAVVSALDPTYSG